MNGTFKICRRCQFRSAASSKVCRTCGSQLFIPVVAEPEGGVEVADNRLPETSERAPVVPPPDTAVKPKPISHLRTRLAEVDQTKPLDWSILAKLGANLFSR